MIGPMVSSVLPPDYNPAGINPYAPGGKLNQGMFPAQELPKSYGDLTSIRFTSRGGQTGSGENFLSNFVGNTEGDQLTLRRRLQSALDKGVLSYAQPLPTAQPQQGMFQPRFPTQFNPYQPMYGGVSYPQFNMGYNPLMGMFSGYGMPTQQLQQQQTDPYALPTSPQANPFGGYTDYTGVNQDFIDTRRRLIDTVAQQLGRSPTEALELLNRTGFLDAIIPGMGGLRYGENSPMSNPNSPTSTPNSSTRGMI